MEYTNNEIGFQFTQKAFKTYEQVAAELSPALVYRIQDQAGFAPSFNVASRMELYGNAGHAGIQISIPFGDLQARPVHAVSPSSDWQHLGLKRSVRRDRIVSTERRWRQNGAPLRTLEPHLTVPHGCQDEQIRPRVNGRQHKVYWGA